MSTTSPRPQPIRFEAPGRERLDSWKEIATYFKTTVRTVQRWEKTEGLPVHRHLHSQRHSVYAFRSELEEWWTSRGASLPPPAPQAGFRRRWVLFALLGVAVAAGAGFWWLRPARDPAPFLKAAPLTSYPGEEFYPTFSPDASQVAFSWNGETPGNFDIYVKVVGSGSGAPLRVTTDPRRDLSPAWSPDGRAIAFLRRLWPDNKAEVLLVPALGGGPERKLGEIYETPAGGLGQGGHFLGWSPDSKWLAAAAAESARGTCRLVLFSAESGQVRTLTQPDPQLTGDVHPSFSPNGRTLAFSRTNNLLSEIYLLDLASDLRPMGNPRQLTSENQQAIAPAWSADGREVIFLSGPTPDTMRLRRIAASGGKPVPVELEYTPVNSFARGAHRLVFSHRLMDTDIWRAELPASGHAAPPPARFISSSRIDDAPQFSPDGSRIAFRSMRSGGPEIYLCNRDGSNTVQLTSYGGPIMTPPRWSVDSKRLGFGIALKGAVQIYVLDAAGGSPRLVLSDPSTETLAPLRWSRDGRWIYFASRRSGQTQTWKAPVGGGEPVQITRHGGFSARESPDGTFVYYLKGIPLSLWRVPVGGGEETLVTDSLGIVTPDFVDGGLYFVTRQGPAQPAVLQFFSLATATARRVAELAAPPGGPITVSPDERTLLYPQSEYRGADLMLVENFR